MADAKDYVEEQTARIVAARDKYPLQPIVFVGSGLSRRWLNAPTWYELLDWAVRNCPEVDRPIQYFRQQEQDLPAVAARLVDFYQSWAWGDGK